VTLVDDGTAIEDSSIVIQGGYIQSVNPEQTRESGPFRLVDGQGWLVSPGLVDLQINGAYGYDFTEDPGTIRFVAERLPETGVVAFLPTIITSPIQDYPSKLQTISAAMEHERGARVLGAHLEGPFLNPEKRGAHDPKLFHIGDPEALAYLSPLETIRLVTLAPEMPAGMKAVDWLTQQGVIVSAGHSAATSDQMLEAIETGIRYITHLFNAMPSLHHRQPGLLGPALTSSRLRCGLIVDGIHVHPLMVKLAWLCLGAKRLTLVTDAMAAMGMPDGRYSIADQTVVVDTKTVRLEDGTLAGSALSLDQAIRNLIAFCGCSPAEALRSASTTPLEVLGLDHKMGHLRPGFPADLVILNQTLQVEATLIGGRVAFATRQAKERLA
jgi:N-acetylglucosamine-6-phosphate deacetylase